SKMHIQLASSRDGVTWRRTEPRTQLIPFGSAEKGDFDAGFMITTQGPIRVGDELRLYYFAMSRPQYTKGLATFPEDVQEKVNRVPLKRGLGMVTWRLDGFASISAKTTPGRVVTKPLVAAGEELVVNADASRGRILVEVLDENNRPLKGLSAQDCEPLVSDAVRQVVRFGGQSGFLKQLAGKTIRLRFSLENADLYSFQFRHSPTIDTGRK
ncbi:MAG: hypothetical protein U9N87_02945, partial [Planctomycetota bacterium]|nr:hypothetical protein [Planctomycetota bacterium]